MWAVGVETNGQEVKSIKYHRTTKWTLPCSIVHGSSHTSHRFWRPHGRRQLSGRWWCRPLSDRGLVEQFDRNIICMRITQSFEYSYVIEAAGEVYILEVLAVTSDVTTSYVCCCPGTTVRPHVQSRGPPTCQMGKYKTTSKYISLLSAA